MTIVRPRRFRSTPILFDLEYDAMPSITARASEPAYRRLMIYRRASANLTVATR